MIIIITYLYYRKFKFGKVQITEIRRKLLLIPYGAC